MSRKSRPKGGEQGVPAGENLPLPAADPLPRGIELRPPIQDSSNQISITQKQSMFSGPIPPPEVLKQYDELIPGTAKLIIEQAHKQTDHRIAMEKRVIDSEVSRSKWGLVAGFVIAMTCLIEGGILVYLEHDVAGGTIATTAVVSLVGVFVYGTAIRRKERTEKARIMSGRTQEG